MRFIAFLHTDGDGWGVSFPDLGSLQESALGVR